MSWVKLDDKFFQHPKVIDLSKDAKLLQLAALAHCNAQLTDGYISVGALRAIAATVDVECNAVTNMLHSVTCNAVTELLHVGLWQEQANGWSIHNYLKYQPSAAQEKERRQAGSARVARWRQGRRESNAESNAVTNSVGNAVSTLSPYPYPYPSSPTSDSYIPYDADVPEQQADETLAAVASASSSKKPSDKQQIRELAERVHQTTNPNRRELRRLVVDDLVAIISRYPASYRPQIELEFYAMAEWYSEHRKRLNLAHVNEWFTRFDKSRDAAARAAVPSHPLNGSGENGTPQKKNRAVARDPEQTSSLDPAERRRRLADAARTTLASVGTPGKSDVRKLP